MAHRLTTLEDNQKTYKGMVEQPLILALNSATPENAIVLLERGADPNVVTTMSQYYMKSSWYSRFTGESALDVANRHLTALGQFKGETDTCPTLPEGIDTYLEGFKEGTYQHWAVSKEIDLRRESHRQAVKRYEENKKSPTSSSGVKEKEAAIAEAVQKMEKVKESLLAHGAKTFAEVYPEFAQKQEAANSRHNYSVPDQKKAEPFNYAFTFRNVIDVTPARKEAYFKLYVVGLDLLASCCY